MACISQELKLAPRAGIEPATLWLTATCSTIELPRNMVSKKKEQGSFEQILSDQRFAALS